MIRVHLRDGTSVEYPGDYVDPSWRQGAWLYIGKKHALIEKRTEVPAFMETGLVRQKDVLRVEILEDAK